MAVLYDNSASGTGAATTLTVPFTVGNNANRILIVSLRDTSSTYPVTGITYAGVSMTLVDQISNTATGQHVQAYILIAPAIGANNLVISQVNANTVLYNVHSYYGARQVSQPDNHIIGTNSAFSTTYSVSLSPIVYTALLYGYVNDYTSITAGNLWGIPNNQTNASSVQYAGDNGMVLGPTYIGGAQSGSTDSYIAGAMTIAPVNIFTRSPSDSIMSGASRTVTVSRIVGRVRSAVDSIMNGASRLATLQRTYVAVRGAADTIMNAASRLAVLSYKILGFVDWAASLVVSGYKWLTSTLLSAQQSSSVRPYYTCKIIDDLIVPNQILFGTGATSTSALLQEDGSFILLEDGVSHLMLESTFPSMPVFQGSAIQAPDGTTLVAGFGPNSVINFWKLADPSDATQWTNFTIIENTGFFMNGDSRQNVSISVSDWINGSYVIDIYYEKIYGSTINILRKRSIDGGLTWGSATVLTSTINYLTTDNVHIAAGTPLRNSDGSVSGIVFYLKKTGLYYDVWYQADPGTGTFGAETKWSSQLANSEDWTLHSLHTIYANNAHQVVFAGYHNIVEQTNGNFGIYVTAITSVNSDATKDLWTTPIEILTANSSSTSNLNQFHFPRITFDGTNYTILFRAYVVDSMANSIVTTNKSHYMIQSTDLANFSYPTALAFSDGTLFQDLSNPAGYCFVKNGSYYYVIGSGNLWQYIKNNVTADVTNSVLAYQIQESADSPFSITLQLGNANGQWYGSAPTKAGASALQKNRKIALFQGFYNANGVGEVVPKNTFFIDDIRQNVSSAVNDLTIQARDLHKKFKTTISKFTFSFLGPSFYADLFDGSTISNWNQILGSWNESSNSMTITQTIPSTTDSVTILSGVSDIKHSYSMAVTVLGRTGFSPAIDQTNYVYAFWQDANNWLRLNFTYTTGNVQTWKVQKCVAGVITDMDNGYAPIGTYLANYTILVRKYSYWKYQFAIGSPGLATDPVIGDGNTIYAFDPTFSSNLPTFLSGSTNGEFDISGLFTQPGSVGIGCLNFLPTFKNFKFAQYDASQNIEDLTKKLAGKAGVTEYKFQNDIEDYFTTTQNYAGTFTAPNNILTIAAGNSAIQNLNQIANGEVSFVARVTPTDPTQAYGLDFVFRNSLASAVGNAYLWNTQNTGTGHNFTSSKFKIIAAPTTYLMTSSSPSIEYGTPQYLNNLNIDLTQWHTYRLMMSDSWMYGFIDEIMVVAWQDNNSTVTPYTTGYFGWQANANTKVEIKSAKSPTFWNQLPSFTLNAGDDIESAIQSVISTVRGWTFSDLMGRMKTLVLNSTDSTTYTYQNLITGSQTDLSDKEYINQVTVYGSNVQATARDLTSIGTNGITRESIVVDYKITTQSDAQSRANYELNNFNKFNNQYSPKQINNVGAETFDVVTVINTGANSSNVNQVVRNYDQTVVLKGGDTVDYSIQIGTGTV